MAVGVPENDVFAAADAVLARGERPTVERVRLELGRGSPARVGSLLDQWWAQLAMRLSGETRLPGLPAEVAQAFVSIWQQATAQAQGVVEQGLAGERQEVANERQALAGLEARARLDIAEARRHASEALSAQQGAETRLDDLDKLLNQQQAQIEDLRDQREELQSARDEAQNQLAGVQQLLLETRDQAEQARADQQRYTQDVENRANREIDRAREEARSLGAQLKDALAKLTSAQHSAQEHQLRASDQISKAALANSELKAELAGTKSHSRQLESRLAESQKLVADMSVEQLGLKERAATCETRMLAAERARDLATDRAMALETDVREANQRAEHAHDKGASQVRSLVLGLCEHARRVMEMATTSSGSKHPDLSEAELAQKEMERLVDMLYGASRN